MARQDRFTVHNTPAYAQSALDILNLMFAARLAAYADIDPGALAGRSIADFVAEQVLADFDRDSEAE